MKKIIRKPVLLAWEIGCIFWIAFAGSFLHFLFELSDYWMPIAVFAAVNESIWEHSKMYFWPGLLFAIVQYTYTRGIANNFWLGKVAALALTPVVIIVSYESYMAYAAATGAKPSLGIMIGIMFFGITISQMVSYKILSADPVPALNWRPVAAGYASLILMFSLFTYFPPKVFVFENFACYTYTGEYGILDDYEPYRVFARKGEDGSNEAGGGVNYCETFKNAIVAQAADGTV